MLIFDIAKFDEQRLYLLVARIKNTKKKYNTDNLDDWYCEGSRYYDNERIVRMLCGYLVDETRNLDGSTNYKAANSKFISMDTSQIDPYIKKAVLESASADYYYKFEKDWG